MDEERLHRVLWGALRIWGVAGTLERDPALRGCFVVCTLKTELRIQHRGQGGWLVFSGNEVPLGEHAGLPGLLRRLREELAPHAAAGRLVIGTQALLDENKEST